MSNIIYNTACSPQAGKDSLALFLEEYQEDYKPSLPVVPPPTYADLIDAERAEQNALAEYMKASYAYTEGKIDSVEFRKALDKWRVVNIAYRACVQRLLREGKEAEL